MRVVVGETTARRIADRILVNLKAHLQRHVHALDGEDRCQSVVTAIQLAYKKDGQKNDGNKIQEFVWLNRSENSTAPKRSQRIND